MAKIPSGHKDTVKSHLPEGETVEAAHSDGMETLVVTENRLLSVASGEKQDRDARRVKTNAFDETAGVTVDVVAGESTRVGPLLLGGTMMLLGTWGIFSLQSLSAPIQALTALVTLVVFGGGAYLVYYALDTDAPHIEVTLRASNGAADRSFKLPKAAEDVASAISEQAAA